MLIVQKFGGSSLAGPERLRRSAGIILEAHRRGNRVLAVVSAAGDSTDELIDLARQLEDRPPLREMDALLSTGEQQSAALMAIMLHALGASARSFTGWQAGIHTDGAHGEARIRQIDPRRLLKALDRGEIAALLAETAARLTEAAKENPSVLAVLDRLDPIRAACEFNISAGHLAGWIASVL